MSEVSEPVLPACRWRDYPITEHRNHTVVGTLKVLPGLHSPQLDNRRDPLVYLPPSYATSQRRYPVLYMHDGQNLFDEVTAYAGEWQVDNTMDEVSRQGIEAIVVGVPNMGGERLNEYSPFADGKQRGGRGAAYVDFLVHTLKPIVDADFRTLPDRRHTAIAGSSMGGLISLYAHFREPAVFGFAGVMSPSLWFADRAIFEYVARAPFVGGTIYLDVGSQEGVEAVHDARRMHDLLLEKGYRKGSDLAFVVEPGGRHEEAAWARRLRKQLTLWLDARPGSRATPAPPR